MSNLELKGGILQMVSSINDKHTLEELKELIASFLGNHVQDTDFWNELSDFEKEQLEQALEESESEENHIAHQEVMQKYSKWLGK